MPLHHDVLDFLYALEEKAYLNRGVTWDRRDHWWIQEEHFKPDWFGICKSPCSLLLQIPSSGSSAPPYPFPTQVFVAPNPLVNTVGTALLKPWKELGIQLVPATASLARCWLMSSTPTQYLRLTNKWVLIPPTCSFLLEEVFACLLPDLSFLHWTLPGFNHFPSSYLQTCHSSCSCSPIFLLYVLLKELCYSKMIKSFLQPWTMEDCSTSDTTIYTTQCMELWCIGKFWLV